MLEQLQEARRSAGWSQRTLAIRIGVDAQAIKRLESGIGSVATLTAAMTALNFQLTGIGPGRELHEQLSNRRRKLGLSLDRVATRARLSRATIASLERGGGSVGSLLRLLSAIAPKARRRAEERAYWGAGDKEDRDSRFTPADFMEPIYSAFGQVDLDPCGHPLTCIAAACAGSRDAAMSASSHNLRPAVRSGAIFSGWRRPVTTRSSALAI
jgi:transcriptional regulator with XRE-family HTH domain